MSSIPPAHHTPKGRSTDSIENDNTQTAYDDNDRKVHVEFCRFCLTNVEDAQPFAMMKDECLSQKGYGWFMMVFRVASCRGAMDARGCTVQRIMTLCPRVCLMFCFLF